LAALAVIGALSISGYALTDLKIFADQSPLHEAASAPIPDPRVSAMLKDVQLLRQQNTAGELHRSTGASDKNIRSTLFATRNKGRSEKRRNAGNDFRHPAAKASFTGRQIVAQGTVSIA
jgi:hypothetical protein